MQINYLKIVVSKITRDRQATLRVVSDEKKYQMDTSEIVRLMTNKSMEVSVSYGDINYLIPFEVKSKNLA